MYNEEEEDKEKSWAERHPRLAEMLKLIGGAGVLAGGGLLAGQYLSKKRRDDLDASSKELAALVSKTTPSKGGEISKAVIDLVDKKKTVTLPLKELIAQKTGMTAEQAGAYLDKVKGSRSKAKDKLLSWYDSHIPDVVTITKDHDEWRKDLPAALRSEITNSTLDKIGPNARHRIPFFRKRDGLIWQGTLDKAKDMLMDLSPGAKDFNGLQTIDEPFRLSTLGRLKRLLTGEAIIGHETSHIPNLDSSGEASGPRKMLQKLFEKARVYPTYPSVPAEALQALSNAKHRIMADHGGSADLTDAQWKSGFRDLMTSDPTTLEQLRLQNYLTPARTSIFTDVEGGRVKSMDDISDTLLKKDDNGVSLLDQLAVNDTGSRIDKMASLAVQYGLAN